MKRSDLIVGEKYVSKDGIVYEVVDLTPGWAVRDDEWHFDPRTDKRFTRKGWVDYIANNRIKVLQLSQPHASATESCRAVIEPRYLMMTLKQYQAQAKIQQQAQGQVEREQQRLTLMAQQMGLKDVQVDLEHEKVVMSLADFGRLVDETKENVR